MRTETGTQETRGPHVQHTARVLRQQEAHHRAVHVLDDHRADDIRRDRHDGRQVCAHGAVARVRHHGDEDRQLVQVEPGRRLHVRLDLHQRLRRGQHQPVPDQRRAGPQAALPAVQQDGVPAHLAGMDAVRRGDGPVLHHGPPVAGGLPHHTHLRGPHRQHLHNPGVHEGQEVRPEEVPRLRARGGAGGGGRHRGGRPRGALQGAQRRPPRHTRPARAAGRRGADDGHAAGRGGRDEEEHGHAPGVPQIKDPNRGIKFHTDFTRRQREQGGASTPYCME
eukprot:605383-Hanusia_phi.AAC.2